MRQEEERRTREDEERRQKEQRWKDMQDQLDKEVTEHAPQCYSPRTWQQGQTSLRTWGVFQREEAFLRAQREAERKRQERELLHIQEEQERLQRKKVPEMHISPYEEHFRPR